MSAQQSRQLLFVYTPFSRYYSVFTVHSQYTLFHRPVPTVSVPDDSNHVTAACGVPCVPAAVAPAVAAPAVVARVVTWRRPWPCFVTVCQVTAGGVCTVSAPTLTARRETSRHGPSAAACRRLAQTGTTRRVTRHPHRDPSAHTHGGSDDTCHDRLAGNTSRQITSCRVVK